MATNCGPANFDGSLPRLPNFWTSLPPGWKTKMQDCLLSTTTRWPDRSTATPFGPTIFFNYVFIPKAEDVFLVLDLDLVQACFQRMSCLSGIAHTYQTKITGSAIYLLGVEKRIGYHTQHNLGILGQKTN